MRQLDTSRFKSAMIDAAILHAERLTENDSEPVAIHSVYREKWEHAVRLLQISQRRKRRQTRLVAFIVAVTVAALAGCAWRYREKIAEFVITTFALYDVLETSGENYGYPTEIENVYFPTYMFDGYELESETKELFKVRIEWRKDDDYLIYLQLVIDQNRYILDNEIGKYTKKQIENHTIFFRDYGELQLYTWLNEYKFCLISSRSLLDNELEQIISSIEKQEK